MRSKDATYQPPPLWTAALEGRTMIELGAYFFSQPLSRLLPKGDGHPVLAFPGFLASDVTTVPMRRVLRKLGYQPYGWGLGRNIGPTEVVVMGIRARLLEIHHEHSEPVSLIGWSLGGVYARRLAARYPKAVRQVITIVSPFRMTDEDRSRSTRLYDALDRFHDPRSRDWLPVERLQMPETAIYSKSDGIVDWRSCLVDPGPQSENVEVIGSHIGMGYNPAALYVVSDRLAQALGEWKAFRPNAQFSGFFPPYRHDPSS